MDNRGSKPLAEDPEEDYQWMLLTPSDSSDSDDNSSNDNKDYAVVNENSSEDCGTEGSKLE